LNEVQRLWRRSRWPDLLWLLRRFVFNRRTTLETEPGIVGQRCAALFTLRHGSPRRPVSQKAQMLIRQERRKENVAERRR
jgi:hypothetical protein